MLTAKYYERNALMEKTIRKYSKAYRKNTLSLPSFMSRICGMRNFWEYTRWNGVHL